MEEIGEKGSVRKGTDGWITVACKDVGTDVGTSVGTGIETIYSSKDVNTLGENLEGKYMMELNELVYWERQWIEKHVQVTKVKKGQEVEVKDGLWYVSYNH